VFRCRRCGTRLTGTHLIDARASVAPVGKLMADGASDVRFAGFLPKDPAQASEVVSELVGAFREVTQ